MFFDPRSRHALRRLAAFAATFGAQAALIGSAHAALLGPTVTSITPAQGSVTGGEQVTINGSGFLGPAHICARGYDIWFGTDPQHGYAITPPSYQVLSNSQIRVAVPANFGGTVNVRVHDACGTSPISGGDRFTYAYPDSQCLSGTCSVDITGAAAGSLGHAGVGLLDGLNTDASVVITPSDEQLLQALHPRQWRFGQAGLHERWGGVFGTARHVGAQISLDLTSDWMAWASSNDPQYASAPYGDLSAYHSFILNDVRARIAANEAPEYFDVWNEPDARGTVNQWLSVYATAYRAIKAADPSARVVGPSIDTFLMQSANQPDKSWYKLSLTDFLNWELRSGDRFAAISWHEDGTTVGASGSGPGPGLPWEPIPGGYRDYWSPQAIADHIEQAKTLLAGYPALAGTKIFVNEYGPAYAANIPGWMVGDFSALERAGADQAMLTCVSSSACESLIDGLIGFDGAPQMPYWVMLAYSRMQGQRLQANSPSNFYALATRADAVGTVQALIGRADDCFGGMQCPQFHASSANPSQVTLSLSIALPASARTATVTVEPLRNDAANPVGDNDVPSTPAATTLSGVPVENGAVAVRIDSASDGDAFYVTATPDAQIQPPARGGELVVQPAPAPGVAPSSARHGRSTRHAPKRCCTRHRGRKRRARPGRARKRRARARGSARRRSRRAGRRA